MIIFSEQDIQDECGYNACIRGKKYFRQGHVIRFITETDSDSLLIKSLVSGTQNYQQSIRITKDEMVNIMGHCSCPVGFNCKHVAAALLNCLDESNNARQLAVKKQLNNPKHQIRVLDNWFEELNKLGEPELDAEPKQANKFLAYILSDTSQRGEIEINFLKTGIKKKGGYYKPQPVSFDALRSSMNYYNSNQYISTIDKVIIALLNTQRDRYFYSYKPILLEGEVGYQILEKLLHSDRCFWSSLSEDSLLHLGDSLAIDYQWQAVNLSKSSPMQLKIDLNSNIRIVPTDPPRYINTDAMTVGSCNTKLSAEQLKLIDQMPPVPIKSLESVSLKLVTENLDQSIPLPVPISITNLNGTHLIPKVLLSNLTLEGMKVNHCLIVSFLYAETDVGSNTELQTIEVKIGGDDNVLIKQVEKFFRINRDLTREKHYFEQIIELGFEMLRYDGNQIALVVPNHLTQQQGLLLWKSFSENYREMLVENGWVVELAENFYLNFIDADENWDMEVSDENDWFSLKFDLNLSNGQKLPLIPVVSPLLKDYSLDNIPEELLLETQTGQYITLKKNKVLPILKLLYELYDSPPISQESIKLSTFDALQVNQLTDNKDLQLNWLGSKKLQRLGKKLANFLGLKDINPSKKFQGELREYQQQGLNWLQFLRDFEFGGLLADDMGLGKTVQTLVHLQKEKMAKRLHLPCLIVAPTSLMSNWKREAQTFTPNLRVLILQGSNRHEKFIEINDYDLVLTTYPLIVRDHKILSSNQFYMIVLDEAQNIKNPKSKVTQLIKLLSTKHRLALTGTPMENHLGELWSIFDFLMPGFLGSETTFRRKYRTPIEKHGNSELSKLLGQRVAPFLLRRTKELVAKELPPKTTIIKSAIMGDAQATLYETIRIAMEKKIEQALATKGLSRSHITILDALLKLRQVCCDPQLLKLTQAKKIKESAKLELLMTMLPELLEEGRRVLLFSQFTSMLTLIETQLKSKKILYSKLTGSTRNREQAINKFTSGAVPLFLISLKAGGVGLNLTEADTVIHYDPWWNPAVENQASDRAHRIGQDKPVFVYKLVVENTLEEKILEMQQRKQALADDVYGKSKGEKQSALTKEDITELLGIR